MERGNIPCEAYLVSHLLGLESLLSLAEGTEVAEVEKRRQSRIARSSGEAKRNPQSDKAYEARWARGPGTRVVCVDCRTPLDANCPTPTSQP